MVSSSLAKTINVLLIGPMPPPLGGTTVSFHSLIKNLKERDDIVISTVNTNCGKKNSVLSVLKFFRLLFNICLSAKNSNVITIHVSTSGLPIIGPLVLIISKLLNKAFIIRKFGGSDYSSQNKLFYFFSNSCANKATLYLVQTKLLLKKSEERGFKNSRWFSNSRHLFDLTQDDRNTKSGNNFVFISQVKRVKGIEIIRKAFKNISPDEATIDIYGPIYDGITKEWLEEVPGISYKGVVHPDSVIHTLLKYDALVFPTYYLGEGYPGVILEAYSAGIPVITTNLLSIPEIVNDETGILIEPQSVSELIAAIRSITSNPVHYQKLRDGVAKIRNDFSHEFWTEKFIEYCKEAIKLKGQNDSKT